MPALLRRDLYVRGCPNRGHGERMQTSTAPPVYGMGWMRANPGRLAATAYDRSMTVAQALLDELWDFSDAAAPRHGCGLRQPGRCDTDERAELETQVARALGLQDRFAEADELLDALSAHAPAVRRDAPSSAVGCGTRRRRGGGGATVPRGGRGGGIRWSRLPAGRRASHARDRGCRQLGGVDARGSRRCSRQRTDARTQRWTRRSAQQRRMDPLRCGQVGRGGHRVREVAGRRAALGHAPAGAVGRDALAEARAAGRERKRDETHVGPVRFGSLARRPAAARRSAPRCASPRRPAPRPTNGPVDRRAPVQTELRADADELLVDELVGGQQAHLARGAASA